MIVEERIYTVRATMGKKFLNVLENGGFEIQKSHLGTPLGYFTTEFGPLNQMIHLWPFKDMEDRARRRAALQADPRWQETLPKLQELLVSQENKLLIPAPFAPVE